MSAQVYGEHVINQATEVIDAKAQAVTACTTKTAAQRAAPKKAAATRAAKKAKSSAERVVAGNESPRMRIAFGEICLCDSV